MKAPQKHQENNFKLSLKAALKFSVGLASILLIRLIPFRAPNIEPILSVTMPFGKYFGALSAGAFGILSILLYDALTHTLGMQTFFTAGAYGAIGFVSASYFKNREGTARNFVQFSILATLFYDAVTGLTVGPIFFHQSFYTTLVGQIPFTALHLLGNVAFAAILSPAVYKFMIKKKKKKKLSPTLILNPLNPNLI